MARYGEEGQQEYAEGVDFADLRASWVENEILKHPNLKGMEDYIHGDSRVDIASSASRLADKIGGPKRDEAREAYGPSFGVVGQPRPSFGSGGDDSEARFNRVAREINQGRRLREDDAKFFVAAGGGRSLSAIRRALRNGTAR